MNTFYPLRISTFIGKSRSSFVEQTIDKEKLAIKQTNISSLTEVDCTDYDGLEVGV